jgi:hypothetical protein
MRGRGSDDMRSGHIWEKSTGSGWHQSNDTYGRDRTGKPEARIEKV